uniref:YwmB family TATA-box binding protein n=1 Tax=Bacillus cereus TaxID=1396 RepID=UPI0020C089D8
LMKEFEASTVEHAVEPHFVSISAFTYKWTDYIITSKHKMNVQVALRSAGIVEKYTVTVGTRVVPTEY